MNNTFGIVIFLLSLFVVTPVSAYTKRHALVIGNSSYKQRSLKNPKQDAKLMAKTLREFGFDLIGNGPLLDASKEDIELAIIRLGKAVKRSKGVAIFYFAGHGVQVAGESYLLPVKMKSFDIDTLPIYAISTNHLLQQLEYAGNKMNFIILDACRDNPFSGATRSMTRGFKLKPKGNSASNLILYGTRPGQVSYDGDRNGPFTKSLVSNMKKGRGLLDDVLRSTVSETERLTKGKQTPWIEGFTREKFYFNSKRVSDRKPRKIEKNQAKSTTILSDSNKKLSSRWSKQSQKKTCLRNQVLREGECKTVCSSDEALVSSGCIKINSATKKMLQSKSRKRVYLNRSTLFKKSIPPYTFWGAGIGASSILLSVLVAGETTRNIFVISGSLGLLTGVIGMAHGYMNYKKKYQKFQSDYYGVYDDKELLPKRAFTSELLEKQIHERSLPIHLNYEISF